MSKGTMLASIALLANACASPAPPSPAPALPKASSVPAAAPPAAPAPEPTEAASERPCPVPDHASHCLWIATTPPNPRRALHVANRMKKDGLNAVADGDRIIVHASDDELKKLFGQVPDHQRIAKSASNGFTCVAKMPDGAELSPRYAGEVGDWILDDPTCEM